MAPKRMSTTKKVLIALGILMLCGFAACGACVAYVVSSVPKMELQNAEARHREVSPELAARMPADEAAFCNAVNKAAKDAKAAGGLSATDAQIAQINNERQAAFSTVIANPDVTGWVGIVIDMKVANGAADFDMQLPCDANVTSLGLRTIPGKEPGKVALGRFSAMQGTPAYAALVQVHPGQVVSFDGSFVIDQQAQLQTANMTDRAKLIAPTFILQLANVGNEQAPAGTKPDSAP